jgi:hypothetical protein
VSRRAQRLVQRLIAVLATTLLFARPDLPILGTPLANNHALVSFALAGLTPLVGSLVVLAQLVRSALEPKRLTGVAVAVTYSALRHVLALLTLPPGGPNRGA